MVNEINGLTPAVTNGTGKKSGRVDSAAADNPQASEAAGGGAGDNFELSAQAQLLNQLEAQINRLPEVDQDRVNALRDAINSGQFDIDSFSLAQDIINFEFK